VLREPVEAVLRARHDVFAAKKEFRQRQPGFRSNRHT
jgi:hypothetical protein